MIEPPNTLFSFSEPDHLIRIHVRLELEDAGFRVAEEGDDLAIVDEAAADPTGVGRDPAPARASPPGQSFAPRVIAG